MKTMQVFMVPADSRSHDRDLAGPVRAVLSRETGIVEVWAEHHQDLAPVARRFLVTAGAAEVEERAVWRGSTRDATDQLKMWHLWEICAHSSTATLLARASCPVCGFRP